MKLTGILKDKVSKAETMEAKKDIIAEAGMELSDDELEMVAGGGHYSQEAPFRPGTKNGSNN